MSEAAITEQTNFLNIGLSSYYILQKPYIQLLMLDFVNADDTGAGVLSIGVERK